MGKKKWSIGFIDFNSPVILGLTVVSFVVLLVNVITAGNFNRYMAAYYTSWADLGMYPRLFTHVVAHANWEHFIGNFLMILVIGPMIEEKYKSKNLLIMFIITAFITGLINVLFFRNQAVLGASGLVFMLILLSSFTNLKAGKIPATMILVAVLYIGREIVTGVSISDNISQISHIVGGLCGAGFGIFLNKDKFSKTTYST